MRQVRRSHLDEVKRDIAREHATLNKRHIAASDIGFSPPNKKGSENSEPFFTSLVGRVGVEPTVSFRRRIMSPLPATSTASGPKRKDPVESGSVFIDCATSYMKKGPPWIALLAQNDREVPVSQR